jgi:hypothetical protein
LFQFLAFSISGVSISSVFFQELTEQISFSKKVNRKSIK